MRVRQDWLTWPSAVPSEELYFVALLHRKLQQTLPDIESLPLN